MIIGHDELLTYVSEGKYIINAETQNVGPASIDLRLGFTFAMPLKGDKPLKLGDRMEYIHIRASANHPFLLKPGHFVLATTIEGIDLPKHLAGFVQGRSSIGRIGLTTQNAGFIDPGFRGCITLELVNESNRVIALVPGYRVVQLVLMETRNNSLAYAGKYNGQIKATGSRMYMDREGSEHESYADFKAIH